MEELSGLGSIEGFRSLAGSTSTAMEAASPRPSLDTGEKPVEDQASVNPDIEMVNFLSLMPKAKQTEDSDQKIISGRQEMLQIKQEKEEMDRSYKERLYSNDTTINEKDSLIKQLEGSVDENESRLIGLESCLQCMEQELKLKDESLKGNLAISESEKNSLELMNMGHILEIEELCQDNKDLNQLLSSFMVKVAELDKEHASVSSHVSRLISSFERFYEMAQEEKMLMARSYMDKFEHLQSQYVDLASENNALKTEIEELKSRLIEFQRTQEIFMVQHDEECQVAEDKIRRLESEAEVSASEINQLEKIASELQGRIQKLLEDSTLAENLKPVKLRRPTELIDLLEGEFQEALNENAKLKAKQTEDSKLWQGLNSKLSSTKTLCDQLFETLQQLASQTEQAEEDKKFFEEMLAKNSKDLDKFNCLLRDLSTKLEDAEQKIISGRQELLQIKQEKEEMDRSYKERLYSNDTTIKEKDSLIKQLEGSVDENESRLIGLEYRLQCMEQELKLKDESLKGNLAISGSEKNSLELMNKGHILEIEELCQGNKDLKQLLSSFMVKVAELDKEHASVSSHVSRLISSFERFYEMAQEEKMLMARSFVEREKILEDQKLQAINEIRKKYELEKIEITNAEKEKAEKLIREIKNKFDEKISQNKLDFERYFTLLKEEHGTMVPRIQQDNEHKESTLWPYHKEELQRIQSCAEIELREGLSLLRKEHEHQIKSLRMRHEEECRRVQVELELQKSKMEENQRALLQLQSEVNSKKEVDDIWDKRQIIYVLALATTASLVFVLQPLLPIAYSKWIIFAIATVWGLGSIGLPFGLYGTSRCETEFSRCTSRLVYTLFTVLVIYSFYLVATHAVDNSAATSPPSLKEAATSDDGWTFWFLMIGLMVLIGNISSWVRGCWTGGDRDT